MSLLRIAAIDFLNPAPLMWNFDHPPEAASLAARYSIERMSPAHCAARLADATADLGLIPIAAYPDLPGLAIVPGCTVASLGSIRSILLIFRGAPAVPVARPEPQTGSQAGFQTSSKTSSQTDSQTGSQTHSQTQPDFAGTGPDLYSPAFLPALQAIRTVALDTASRTSAWYTRILFSKYWGQTPRAASRLGLDVAPNSVPYFAPNSAPHSAPQFAPHAPDLEAMLATADAALLIGDPALYALEHRAGRLARTGESLLYLDLGHAWHQQTGLPWVSAVWAVRVASLAPHPHAATDAAMLAADLQGSRDAGLAHLPALAAEWSGRLHLPRPTIETYLTRNIHYRLDEPCLAGMQRFYADATECGLLPKPPELAFL